MPHIIIKAWPGKTDAQKQELADEIARSVSRIFNHGSESVSVAFEEVAPDRWKRDVYEPDIVRNPGRLLKAPGYRM